MPRGERKDPVWTKLPVPGVVTARRDVTQTLKLRQKRQEEEEQLKKQQRQAEEAARILSRRWRQEDRGESGGRHGREDGEEDEGREDEGREGPEGVQRQRSRDGVRSGRGAEPAGVWVVTEEPRRPRPPPPRPHRGDTEAVERRPPAEIAAAFEGPARPEKRRRERSPSPAAGPPQPRWEEVARPPSASTGRRSPSPGGLEQQEAAPAARPKAKGRSSLAGVFGLGDSDEERESAARQMELAAAGRRQTFARRAGIAATGAPGSSGSAPRDREAPKALDPAEVYMRCSQWKQSCNGKEMPMPEELRRALVEVTGNALGHGAPTPARRA